MLTLDVLRSSACQDRQHTDERLSDSAAQAQLAVLSGWSIANHKLVKRYTFKNYYQTIAFVNALVFIVHDQDHHPELNVTYNQCHIAFDTHSVKGLSLNDFICAAKIDGLLQAD